MTEQVMREAFEDRMQLDVMQAGKHAEGWYLDRTVSAAWAGWTEALQWAAEGQEPVAWMSSRNGFIGKQRTNGDCDVPLYAAPVPNADLLAEVERLRVVIRAYVDAGFGNSTDFHKQGLAYDAAVDALGSNQSALAKGE